MINSCLGLFTAACLRRHPFFRSYGVNMPSSLTTLLPLALGFSPHLPVSVYGTGTKLRTQPFLAASFTCFPTITSVPFARGYHRPGQAPLSCQLFKFWRLRNLYRMCIDYALRPRLSSRLTRGGRTYPRKPYIFGHYDSHTILANHSGILTRIQSTAPYGTASPQYSTLPYPV